MKKGFTLDKVLICIAILCILGSIIVGGFFNFAIPSMGTRAGIISKLSEKGLIWKTSECQMMIGSGNSGELWNFSVSRNNPDSKEIVKNLLDKMSSGKIVEVEYMQKLFTLKSEAETTYLVTKILEKGE